MGSCEVSCQTSGQGGAGKLTIANPVASTAAFCTSSFSVSGRVEKDGAGVKSKVEVYVNGALAKTVSTTDTGHFSATLYKGVNYSVKPGVNTIKLRAVANATGEVATWMSTVNCGCTTGCEVGCQTSCKASCQTTCESGCQTCSQTWTGAEQHEVTITYNWGTSAPNQRAKIKLDGNEIYTADWTDPPWPDATPELYRNDNAVDKLSRALSNAGFNGDAKALAIDILDEYPPVQVPLYPYLNFMDRNIVGTVKFRWCPDGTAKID
jgi:hypothetical protein